MEFSSPDGEDRYAALVAAAATAVIGLDFDGTLSPIVDDPDQAAIHPDAAEVLTALADVVAAIAVITGRPARQALALGDLDEVGSQIGADGKELHLFGQYGNERWSSTQRRIVSPRPPAGFVVVSRRAAGACSDGTTPPTRSWRRRGSRSPFTRAGWTTPPVPSSGYCRRSGSWPRSTP